jgi:putative ABC transport system permease protein
MKLIRLAIQNIQGSGFRSFVIFLCVMSLSAFLFSTTLMINGAQNSLNVGISRLGADIIVVPSGAESKVESALLMGKPTNVWMPANTVEKVASTPGVERVTPHIYLQSLYGADCCAVSEMFMTVFDPSTDFVVEPWLKQKLGRDLQPGEVFGGTYIYVPPGQPAMRIYGSWFDLKGNLEPTGTGLDQTLFMTMDTAQLMAKESAALAVQQLEIPSNSISTVMVKVTPGVDAHRVALDIAKNVTGVVAIESPNLFGMYRQQMNGLLWGFFAILAVIWAVTIVLIGLVFSMAANERRREIAVLRALGATRFRAVNAILIEAALLAVGAGLVGTIFAALGTFLFKDMLVNSLKMPFLFPSMSSLGALGMVSVLLALITVTFAAFFPALRITGYEPAIAMRE